MLKYKLLLRYITLSAVILCIAFVQVSIAQQEITVGNDFGVGARAMGMGGAYTSVADDFTAVYWNPAGLSHLKRMEFYGAMSHEKVDKETEYFGDINSTFVSNTKPNSFGIVLPVPTYQGGLAFAFGVNRVQSFDARSKVKGFNNLTLDEDPELGQLNIDELTDESGGIYSWDFGAAVDIAPNVSLGATLSFLSGRYDYSLKLDANDTKNLDSNITGISYQDTITTDYLGVEGKVGLLARVAKPLKLGLTITIPMSFSASEYWTQDTYYAYDDGTDDSQYDEGTFDYDISRPFRFNLGLSLLPIPNALISADVSYTDWTQTEYSKSPSEDVSNEDFINDYRATAGFRVGAEYYIPQAGLMLRAGYILDPLSYKPEDTEIKTDRQFITAGVGLIMDESFSMDIAYLKGFSKVLSNNGNISKKLDSNRIMLSADFKF
jgi:long-subunit fatty acid transport protein